VSFATFLAGHPLTAPELNALAGRSRIFVGVSQVTYNANVVFQNDPDLSCSLEGNSEYLVEIHGQVFGTAGDIQTNWSTPSGATGVKHCFGPSNATEAQNRLDSTGRWGAHNLGTAVAYGVHSASDAAVMEYGRILTVSAGSFTWQHCQETSDASDSGVGNFRYMTVIKVA
jgi:hypothetical protein